MKFLTKLIMRFLKPTKFIAVFIKRFAECFSNKCSRDHYTDHTFNEYLFPLLSSCTGEDFMPHRYTQFFKQTFYRSHLAREKLYEV